MMIQLLASLQLRALLYRHVKTTLVAMACGLLHPKVHSTQYMQVASRRCYWGQVESGDT
jgi:hypothetical protein